MLDNHEADGVPDATLTLAEAADVLGVHYMTAYRYVRTGRLEASKVGGEWRVPTEAVDRLVPGPSPERHALAGPGPATGSGPVAGRTGQARARYRVRLEDRMVAGDEAGAWAVVEAAQAGGADPADLYLDLLIPALRSLGDRWEAGALSIADEHRASVVALRLIGRLGPRFARRGRKRGTVVIGAPAGERHAIPVAVVADLLRQVGFEVVDLGPDTPPASFVEAVALASATGRLVAVLIGVTVPAGLEAARTTVGALAAWSEGSGDPVPVLVGGAAVRDATAAAGFGASAYTGVTGADAVAAVERLVELTRSGS
jgi:excisionase family DNA binding protein